MKKKGGKNDIKILNEKKNEKKKTFKEFRGVELRESFPLLVFSVTAGGGVKATGGGLFSDNFCINDNGDINSLSFIDVLDGLYGS